MIIFLFYSFWVCLIWFVNGVRMLIVVVLLVVTVRGDNLTKRTSRRSNLERCRKMDNMPLLLLIWIFGVSCLLLVFSVNPTKPLPELFGVVLLLMFITLLLAVKITVGFQQNIGEKEQVEKVK